MINELQKDAFRKMSEAAFKLHILSGMASKEGDDIIREGLLARITELSGNLRNLLHIISDLSDVKKES